MQYLGCHLSSAQGFEHMGREALSIGADTFAFFTRNPRGGRAREIDPQDAKRLGLLLAEHGFGPLVAHAPYTLNPASDKPHVREFAKLCLTEDMQRMEYLPGNFYNLHPGSHVGQGTEQGIGLITDLLNGILSENQTTVVLLETMAGKGTEIGGSFEELAAILSGVRLQEKVGVCLDTCHISDGGYDVSDPDGVLAEFDRVIGLGRLRALHVNDSRHPQGSRKDRHARLGEGTIGQESLVRFLRHPALLGLPCILETPNDLGGYAREIRVLRKALQGA